MFKLTIFLTPALLSTETAAPSRLGIDYGYQDECVNTCVRVCVSSNAHVELADETKDPLGKDKSHHKPGDTCGGGRGSGHRTQPLGGGAPVACVSLSAEQ